MSTPQTAGAAPETVGKILLPRSFYYLLSGDVISRIGDYVYQLAIPLFVLHLTGSAVWMGTAFAVEQSALILMGFFGGALVDRYDPKRVLVVNAVAQTVLVSLIPLLYLLDAINVYVVLLLGFLLTGCNFLYRVGNNTVLPRVVAKEQLPLAGGQVSMSKSLSKTFGPLIAGFLIAMFSPVHSLWIDGVSFVVLFLLMTLLRVQGGDHAAKPKKKQSILRDVREGFGYLFQSGNILLMILFNFLVNLGFCSMFAMFIFHLKDTLDFSSGVIGTIFAADGVGAFIAGLFLPKLMKNVPNGLLMILSSCLLGLSIFLIGFVSNPFWVALFFGMVMFSSQLNNRTMYTVWQMTVPKEILGRVFSLATMLESIAVPLAGIGGGYLAAQAGSFFQMKVSGLIILLFGFCLLFTKLRKLDNRVAS